MANTKLGAQRGAATKAANKRASIKRDADGFTEGERRFVRHMLGAGRGIIGESALLAGYGRGNLLSARKYGSDLMQKPHIIAELDRLKQQLSAALEVSAHDILRDLVILRSETEAMPSSIQTLKLRREITKDMGDHVAVGAFRRQVGLSSPTGGPIEQVDAEWLANATDEELDDLERARSIIDRRAGRAAPVPDGGDDQGGEGTAPEGS